MSISVKTIPWELTYTNCEGTWSAKFILEDLEGDWFTISVISSGGEYEMTFDTNESSYFMLGNLEVNKLSAVLNAASRQLQRLEEKDDKA
jgi:hypothetical protein|tara:strand:- start:1213 stop:1482 length:270 start_codon:yes stop_codon:yes gene_type:complete